MSMGLRTPGPIHLFARFRSNPVAAYLGTCVAAPDPGGEKNTIPVMNDLSGRSVPFQLIQDGETCMVMATMNRFDLVVFQGILALSSNAGGGNVALLGTETGFARGTFVLGVSDFELIIINGYAGTAAQGLFVGNVSDLPLGRRYFSSNLRTYKYSTLGTRVYEISFAIECQNIFDPVTRGFALYTENSAAIGPLAPIT